MALATWDNNSTDESIFNNFAQKAFQGDAWNSFDQFQNDDDKSISSASINNESSDEDDEIKNYSCVECSSFNLIYNDGLFS